jgi:hypothetical protein
MKNFISLTVVDNSKKKAGDLHHTAQPPTLAAFRPWGSSAGAGRVRPASRKYTTEKREINSEQQNN